jgi:uncharacterized phiE125 gp8 family phage protein
MIDWALHQLQLPAQQPLSLIQAKQHVRIPADVTEFDDLLNDAIQGARAYLEDAYDIRFVKQRVRLTLETFPRESSITIPIRPVQSFDEFTWVDVAGAVHVLTVGDAETVPVPDVYGILTRRPAKLVLPFGRFWPPAVLATAEALRVDMTVGFLTGDSPELLPMPPGAIQAMKLLIGHSFNNGSAVTIGSLQKSDPLAMGVQSLMANVRLW